MRRPARSAVTAAAAALALAAVLAAAPSAAGRPACAPGACALAPPTADELAALVAEADRLVARYAGDSTALGRRCLALGDAMRAGAADVRLTPYMWRAPDADGDLRPVTGDAHAGPDAAPRAGSDEAALGGDHPAGAGGDADGAVHIARGFDALNPDRGLPAILQTARHEFAHLVAHGAGERQVEGWGADAAARVAAECGPR